MKKKRIWAAYALRLPPALKDTLEREAALSGRSLNAEIVHRLRASVEGYRTL